MAVGQVIWRSLSLDLLGVDSSKLPGVVLIGRSLPKKFVALAKPWYSSSLTALPLGHLRNVQTSWDAMIAALLDP